MAQHTRTHPAANAATRPDAVFVFSFARERQIYQADSRTTYHPCVLVAHVCAAVCAAQLRNSTHTRPLMSHPARVAVAHVCATTSPFICPFLLASKQAVDLLFGARRSVHSCPLHVFVFNNRLLMFAATVV